MIIKIIKIIVKKVTFNSRMMKEVRNPKEDSKGEGIELNPEESSEGWQLVKKKKKGGFRAAKTRAASEEKKSPKVPVPLRSAKSEPSQNTKGDGFMFDLRSKEGYRKRVNMPRWKKPKQRSEQRSRGQKRKADKPENGNASKKKELVLLSDLSKDDQDFFNYFHYMQRKIRGLPYEDEVPQVSRGIRNYIIEECKKEVKGGEDIQDQWFEDNCPYASPTSGSMLCLNSEIRDIEQARQSKIRVRKDLFSDQTATRDAVEAVQPKPKERKCKKMKLIRKIRKQQKVFKKDIKLLKSADLDLESLHLHLSESEGSESGD